MNTDIRLGGLQFPRGHCNVIQNLNDWTSEVKYCWPYNTHAIQDLMF